MPDTPAAPEPARSLSVAEVAQRYRISPNRVRSMIARGELAALDLAEPGSGRALLRVTPQALADFERRRSATPPPTPPRRKRTVQVDYFPGD